MTSDLYDLIVIGGGAAGLSAALVLAQGKCSVLVLDSGRARNRFDHHIHGYLSRDGMPPSGLLEVGRDEVRRFGGEIRSGVVSQVESVGKPGHPRFRVVLDDGEELRAKRLVIATGINDTLPPVHGLEEFWGGAVFHCPYCHGAEIEPDTVIGVLGCGPQSIAKAHMMLQWADKVILLLNDKVELSDDDRRALTHRGIEIVEGPVTALEVRGGTIVGARVSDGVVDLDEMLVAPESRPNRELLDQLGVTVLDEADDLGTLVECDPSGCTEVEGVWACGNVRDSNAQVINAAGQGVRAAIAINASLTEEHVADALAASAP